MKIMLSQMLGHGKVEGWSQNKDDDKSRGQQSCTFGYLHYYIYIHHGKFESVSDSEMAACRRRWGTLTGWQLDFDSFMYLVIVLFNYPLYFLSSLSIQVECVAYKQMVLNMLMGCIRPRWLSFLCFFHDSPLGTGVHASYIIQSTSSRNCYSFFFSKITLNLKSL